MLSTVTNVVSLQAQNYLLQTENSLDLTTQQVTSGLRIVNSGVDAAGLAVANGDVSNDAVLTQGVQNASNANSELQIADGGLSNISQLLDRARTLATESASGSFTGDRSVLNDEFQSVIQEVNRQAQAIGLNQGGNLASNLGVFVGGGESSNGISATENGTVNVNLSDATVDAKSLGLEGVQASGNTSTDIGDGSVDSVQNILGNASNQQSISNNTATFYVYGPGFSNTSGNDAVALSVNLNGVTNADTLVTAINSAIQAAGNGGTQQATAFQNANITAATTTNPAGQTQLAFSSANTAFSVQGGDQMANAFLGNFSDAATAQGTSAAVTATAAGAFTAPAAAETGVQIRITGAGLNGGDANDLSVNIGTADTAVTMVAKINAAIAANTTVAATGITAVNDGGTIQFVGGQPGQTFQVQTAGDTANALGFGSFASSTANAGTAGTFDYTSVTAGEAFANVAAAQGSTQDVQVSLNGGPTIDLGAVVGGYTAAGDETTAIANLNAAFQGNAATAAAGLEAEDNGGSIEITSTQGDNFRVNFNGANDAFGFGTAGVSSTTNAVAQSTVANDTVASTGAQTSVNATDSDPYLFTGITNPNVSQTVTLSSVDTSGNDHSLNVTLNSGNAGNLDQALQTINNAIQSDNDSTLGQIAAFKMTGTSGDVNGQQGIQFMSAGAPFTVSLGATQASVGGTDYGLSDGVTGANGGPVRSSAANGTGATANISNVSTATAAVNQLANSVEILGNAQAAVGRGENLMNYASNLANSQLTNTEAAESGIMDVDMASASANLTQQQIQLQAGIAALAQANSNPQQILALLQHP